jgi:hypothetical protein
MGQLQADEFEAIRRARAERSKSMTYDPYEDAGLRRDLPKTDPQMVHPEETRTTIWLPIAIAVALFIGLGYYFYGHVGSGPAMRADSGAITKSEPSPN